LQQRIAVRATIAALTLRQSFRYVRHRLAVAGRAEDNPLFSFAALSYIANAAGGNPRKLNIYCDNALINGLGHRAERITLPIAREALHHFRQSIQPKPWRLRWIAAAAIIVALGTLASRALWSSIPAWLGRSSEEQIAAASTAGPTAEPAVTLPIIQAPPAATDPPLIGAVASDASAADGVRPAAALPLGTTGPPVSLTSSTAEPAPDATTTVEPVAATEPPWIGVTVRRGDAAPFRPDGRMGVIVRPDGRIDVTVRPGDSLLHLCLRIYGTCDTATLRRLLETNPKIRSANLIVSGETVVFQPRQSAESGSD
jgi:general secretion pathway protein A